MNREIFQLAVQGLRRRRKSSLLVFAVLCLSFCFAIITLSVSGSMAMTNEEYRKDTFGEWEGVIPDSTPEDRAFLEGSSWLESLGTMEVWGTLSAGEVGGVTFGTANEAFLEMGRIRLQDGRMPEAENEIVLEADSLSALGYDYTLGQELALQVSFPGAPADAAVDRTFTLCGVLKEYTGFWLPLMGQRGELCSALVSEDTAAALRQEAEENSQGQPAVSFENPVTHYFFTAREGMEKEMRKDAKEYSDSPDQRNQRVRTNRLAYGENADEKVRLFYTGLIFAVTVLAVLCIYAIQLQKQVRQYALFRSIGIKKSQLRKMILFETCLLCVPAAALGAAGGALGTWAVLKLAVYSGSVAVRLALPWELLGPIALVWFLGIVLARLVILQIALREPLTGRVAMGNKKARRWKRARKALIGALSVLLCGTLAVTVLEAFPPYNAIQSSMILSDYSIHRRKEHDFSLTTEGVYPTLIPDSLVEALEAVPGVADARARALLFAELRFDGMEGSEYYESLREGQRNRIKKMGIHPPDYSPDALAVWVLAPREGELESHFDFKRLGIDPEAFRRGEQVIISLASSYEPGITVDGGVETGDTVELSIYGYAPGTRSVIMGWHDDKFTPGLWRFSPKAVVLHEVPGGCSPYFTDAGYVVYCSYEYLEKAFRQMEPEGLENNVYITGGDFGYDELGITAGMDAGYLATDLVVAGLCEEQGFELQNFREYNAAIRQENLQTLILLLSSGGCTLLVLLLILTNTLALEAQREQRERGILQALGISKRQTRRKLLKTALFRGVLGAAAGWLLFGGFLLADTPRVLQEALAYAEQNSQYDVTPACTTYQEALEYSVTRMQSGGVDLWVVLAVTLAGIGAVLALTALAKRPLLRGGPMEKLRDEE